MLYRISSVLFYIFEILENNELVVPWVPSSSPSEGPSLCLRTLETFLLRVFSNLSSIFSFQDLQKPIWAHMILPEPSKADFLMAYSVFGLGQCYKCLIVTNRRKHLPKGLSWMGMAWSLAPFSKGSFHLSLPFYPYRKTVLYVQHFNICK